MAERDLYKALGVARTASEAEIRKAYRKAAKENHPDRNPDDTAAEERFKSATQASDVLLNSKKRKLYDEFGDAGLRDGFDPEAARHYNSRGGGFGGFDASNIEEMLRNAAGGRGGGGFGFQDAMGGDVVDAIFGKGARAKRGQDLQSEVKVSFVEALEGVERSLNFQVPGKGPRSVRVRIPAGVKNGGKVRLKGQGADGGDLVLLVRVGEHGHFRRQGNDLLLELPITAGEAIAGGKVPVPTLEGEVMLAVPAGVKGGSKLRLRGKGVRVGRKQGDLIVQLRIHVPAATAEDQELLAAAKVLDAALNGDVRKDVKLK